MKVLYECQKFLRMEVPDYRIEGMKIFEALDPPWKLSMVDPSGGWGWRSCFNAPPPCT